ncbi:MAG: GAF domain-containing sensor histidine kinase [Deltaproteobacteria bacterium]|nr:GAF domain-containing sensor histidine kinase [Deltaproteobacteria bacterium]
MPAAFDILTEQDRSLLTEYARRMLPHAAVVGSAWAKAWVDAVPARDVDPGAYQQVVEYLACESTTKVCEFLLADDLDGLFLWQYENNREGARRQLGNGAVLVFNQHELHAAARAGHPVITGWIERAFGHDPLLAARIQLVQEKLGGLLSTVLSEAYSDEREGHLTALGDKLRRALEVSERLRQVGQAITQSLEIEPVLDLALRTAAELLQADCAGLTLANEEGTAHRLTRVYGADIDSFPAGWTPIEGSLTGLVYQRNLPARSGRRAPRLEETTLGKIRSLGVEAYVVVPLRARGKPIGTLGVFCRTPRRFSGDDESVLQRMGDSLAIAVENTRIFAAARAALAAAQQASRDKSEFVAAVSHEISAPLSSVLGYVDLLRDDTFGAATSNQREIFDRLDVITRSTLRLTNDLLDHARLDAGGLPVQMARVAVDPLVAEIVDSARLMIGERPVRCTARVSPFAESVYADVDRLRQILVNLVSNAVKFTAKGNIEVDVLRLRGQDRVQFLVRDSGSGIGVSHLPRIFELFYRADPTSSCGAGIGLFLSRQLARSMGGDLSVESEVGHGTTFTLSLQVAE